MKSQLFYRNPMGLGLGIGVSPRISKLIDNKNAPNKEKTGCETHVLIYYQNWINLTRRYYGIYGRIGVSPPFSNLPFFWAN